VSSPAQQLFDGLLSVINAFMGLERGPDSLRRASPRGSLSAKYREGLGDRQPGGLATVNHYRSVRQPRETGKVPHIAWTRGAGLFDLCSGSFSLKGCPSSNNLRHTNDRWRWCFM